jgi:flagellar basal-body rod protein FlgC
MDFKTALTISGSGLTASRAWIDVTSANLANAKTTRTTSGEPYRRRTLIYESAPAEEQFGAELNSVMDDDVQGVRVADVVPDNRDFVEVYDPSNPDADKNGIVRYPNVDTAEEMANLVSASRSYEANVAALDTAKRLALKAIDIGK